MISKKVANIRLKTVIFFIPYEYIFIKYEKINFFIFIFDICVYNINRLKGGILWQT